MPVQMLDIVESLGTSGLVLMHVRPSAKLLNRVHDIVRGSSGDRDGGSLPL